VSTRRLLVVATGPVAGDLLRDEVRKHAADADADVRIVAPAADISPLRWLTSDEDAARAEAEGVAKEASTAVETEAARVEAEAGDTNPIQAIEDALRTFPADELVIVTRPDQDSTWLEQGTATRALERFNLPVTHLPVAGSSSGSG